MTGYKISEMWDDPNKILIFQNIKSGPDSIANMCMVCENLKEIVEGKVVLDIGCASGCYAIYSAIKSKLTIGLDMMESAIKKGFYDAKTLELGNLFFLCGDTQRLPIRSNSVDVILISNVLEHVPDYKGTISEMERVLKKGGILLIVIPNEERISGYTFTSPKGIYDLITNKRFKPANIKDVDIGTYHFHTFDIEYLLRYLKEDGFKIIKIRYFFFYFLGILYLFHWRIGRHISRIYVILGKRVYKLIMGHEFSKQAGVTKFGKTVEPKRIFFARRIHPLFARIHHFELKLFKESNRGGESY